MIKTPIRLQDLRKKIYIKAKAGKKKIGWNRWSKKEIYEMRLYNDYQIRYYNLLKANPA
jgi:hypothetical protein